MPTNAQSAIIRSSDTEATVGRAMAALRAHTGNITAAARRLGITADSLKQLISEDKQLRTFHESLSRWELHDLEAKMIEGCRNGDLNTLRFFAGRRLFAYGPNANNAPPPDPEKARKDQEFRTVLFEVFESGLWEQAAARVAQRKAAREAELDARQAEQRDSLPRPSSTPRPETARPHDRRPQSDLRPSSTRPPDKVRPPPPQQHSAIPPKQVPPRDKRPHSDPRPNRTVVRHDEVPPPPDRWE